MTCPNCNSWLPKHFDYCRRPSAAPSKAAVRWAMSLWPPTSPRRAAVVEMREAGLTFAQIGRVLVVSAGRAQSIQASNVADAEMKLRHWSSMKLDDQLRYAREALAEHGTAKALVGIDMLLEGAQ